jgi:ABC-type cobalamin/Fe3+-siderophores transport system ATPase subunit
MYQMIEAIKATSISAAYQHTIALREISFSVQESECRVILGPNGSGKTTLLRTINGLTSLLSGKMEVLGQVMNNRNASLLRKRIGYIPQVQAIDPKFPVTVSEVVSMGRLNKRSFLKWMTSHDQEILEQIMTLTGIIAVRHKPIGHLSGGEQQKVAIARALAQEPDILLFDEPTSNLDIPSQYAVIDLIDRINAEKKITMIMVTHLIGHIPVCAEKIILMKDGKIIAERKKTELSDASILAGLYNCTIQEMNRYLHSEIISQ